MPKRATSASRSITATITLHRIGDPPVVLRFHFTTGLVSFFFLTPRFVTAPRTYGVRAVRPCQENGTAPGHATWPGVPRMFACFRADDQRQSTASDIQRVHGLLSRERQRVRARSIPLDNYIIMSYHHYIMIKAHEYSPPRTNRVIPAPALPVVHTDAMTLGYR